MFFLPLMVLWARDPMTFSNRMRWGTGILLVAMFVLIVPVRKMVVQAATVNAVGEVHREGTRVVLIGKLQDAGRRLTFQTAENGTLDGPSYELLENLALQRLVQAKKNDSDDVMWKVSGQLTEFFDENFLLIDRAVRAPQIDEAVEP